MGKENFRLLVNDVERLGKSTAMNGKGKEISKKSEVYDMSERTIL